MSAPELRLATEADLPAINDIHSHYVKTTTSTYALEPMTPEQRHAWFVGRAEIHPVTVVEIDGEIVSWGAMGTFRVLGGYRNTVENSLYVHPNHVRKGLGTLMLLDQLDRCRQLGLHAIVAVVDSGQTASIQLHLKHGFKEVGRLPQIGRKFDRWLDAVFLEMVFDD